MLGMTKDEASFSLLIGVQSACR